MGIFDDFVYTNSMKKEGIMRLFWLIVIVLFAGVCFAEGANILLDDFEGNLIGGPEGTVDFGSGNGSAVAVSADQQMKHTGNQSLKVDYQAVSGGYIWIARGYGLDAKNSSWLIKPDGIEWKKVRAISVWVYGNNSQANIAFDIKDSGNEIFRYLIEDTFTGWKQIVCSLDDFLPRGDWQPDNADNNFQLDFPLKSFQFEPKPESKGVFYFDTVELVIS